MAPKAGRHPTVHTKLTEEEVKAMDLDTIGKKLVSVNSQLQRKRAKPMAQEDHDTLTANRTLLKKFKPSVKVETIQDLVKAEKKGTKATVMIQKDETILQGQYAEIVHATKKVKARLQFRPRIELI